MGNNPSGFSCLGPLPAPAFDPLLPVSNVPFFCVPNCNLYNPANANGTFDTSQLCAKDAMGLSVCAPPDLWVPYNPRNPQGSIYRDPTGACQYVLGYNKPQWSGGSAGAGAGYYPSRNMGKSIMSRRT
jgi:hypothetical protein